MDIQKTLNQELNIYKWKDDQYFFIFNILSPQQL